MPKAIVLTNSVIKSFRTVNISECKRWNDNFSEMAESNRNFQCF